VANSKIKELAGRLNEMKNPSLIGISVGTVINTNPFTLSIADGNILLAQGDVLEVCEALKKRRIRCEVSVPVLDNSGAEIGKTDAGAEGYIEIDPEIKKGDQIAVVPTADEQTWIAIGRIEVIA
jgi:predicted ribosome-associated RNA-binding protein Tma20